MNGLDEFLATYDQSVSPGQTQAPTQPQNGLDEFLRTYDGERVTSLAQPTPDPQAALQSSANATVAQERQAPGALETLGHYARFLPGPAGAVGSAIEDWTTQRPTFDLLKERYRAAPFAPAIMQFGENRMVGAARRRQDEGNATEADYRLLERRRLDEEQQKNQSFPERAAGFAQDLTSFALELYLTRGLSIGPKIAGKVTSYLTRAGTAAEVAEGIAIPVSRTANIVGQIAGRLGEAGLRAGTSQLPRTLAAATEAGLTPEGGGRAELTPRNLALGFGEQVITLGLSGGIQRPMGGKITGWGPLLASSGIGIGEMRAADIANGLYQEAFGQKSSFGTAGQLWRGMKGSGELGKGLEMVAMELIGFTAMGRMHGFHNEVPDAFNAAVESVTKAGGTKQVGIESAAKMQDIVKAAMEQGLTRQQFEEQITKAAEVANSTGKPVLTPEMLAYGRMLADVTLRDAAQPAPQQPASPEAAQPVKVGDKFTAKDGQEYKVLEITGNDIWLSGKGHKTSKVSPAELEAMGATIGPEAAPTAPVAPAATPAPAMIDRPGGPYADTPHMRALVAEADAIRSSLPPVPEGHTRLWRGNRPSDTGTTFTTSLEGIALPFQKGYGGRLSYVDVPTADLGKYENKVAAAKGAEFNLPKDVAARAAAATPAPAEKPARVKQPWEMTAGEFERTGDYVVRGHKETGLEPREGSYFGPTGIGERHGAAHGFAGENGEVIVARNNGTMEPYSPDGNPWSLLKGKADVVARVSVKRINEVGLHRALVEDALARGEHVPKEVLAEYGLDKSQNKAALADEVKRAAQALPIDVPARRKGEAHTAYEKKVREIREPKVRALEAVVKQLKDGAITPDEATAEINKLGLAQTPELGRYIKAVADLHEAQRAAEPAKPPEPISPHDQPLANLSPAELDAAVAAHLAANPQAPPAAKLQAGQAKGISAGVLRGQAVARVAREQGITEAEANKIVPKYAGQTSHNKGDATPPVVTQPLPSNAPLKNRIAAAKAALGRGANVKQIENAVKKVANQADKTWEQKWSDIETLYKDRPQAKEYARTLAEKLIREKDETITVAEMDHHRKLEEAVANDKLTPEELANLVGENKDLELKRRAEIDRVQEELKNEARKAQKVGARPAGAATDAKVEEAVRGVVEVSSQGGLSQSDAEISARAAKRQRLLDTIAARQSVGRGEPAAAPAGPKPVAPEPAASAAVGAVAPADFVPSANKGTRSRMLPSSASELKLHEEAVAAGFSPRILATAKRSAFDNGLSGAAKTQGVKDGWAKSPEVLAYLKSYLDNVWLHQNPDAPLPPNEYPADVYAREPAAGAAVGERVEPPGKYYEKIKAVLPDMFDNPANIRQALNLKAGQHPTLPEVKAELARMAKAGEIEKQNAYYGKEGDIEYRQKGEGLPPMEPHGTSMTPEEHADVEAADYIKAHPWESVTQEELKAMKPLEWEQAATDKKTGKTTAWNEPTGSFVIGRDQTHSFGPTDYELMKFNKDMAGFERVAGGNDPKELKTVAKKMMALEARSERFDHSDKIDAAIEQKKAEIMEERWGSGEPPHQPSEDERNVGQRLYDHYTKMGVVPPGVANAMEMGKWVADAVGEAKLQARELGGEFYPAVHDASRPTGEALVHHAVAGTYAREAAPAYTQEVMGTAEDAGNAPLRRKLQMAAHELRQRVTEDYFKQRAADLQTEHAQALKDGKTAEALALAEKFAVYTELARQVGEHHFIGRTNVAGETHFPTENEFQDFIATQRFQKFFLQDWKGFEQVMERNLRGSQGMDDTDPINSPTQIPGHAFNAMALKAGDKAGPGVVWFNGPGAPGEPGKPPVGSRGRLTNVQLKKYAFAEAYKGNADGYDTDVANVVENSLVRGTRSATLAIAYRTAVEEGRADWGPRGRAPSDEFTHELPVTLIPKGTQENQKGETSLWFKTARELEEFRKATAPDKRIDPLPGANALARVTLASAVEFVYHERNKMTSEIAAGRIPILDTWTEARRLWKNDLEVQKQLTDLAEMGALRGRHEGDAGALWGGKTDPTYWMGKFGNFMDRAHRLALDKAYDRLVKRGDAVDSEASRRNYINAQLGQYEIRGQHKLVALARDTGLGPFATGATTAYAKGIRSLVGGSGAEATSPQASLRMRRNMFAKMGGIAAAVGVANLLMWGRWDGDDETPLGSWKVAEVGGRSQYINLMSIFTPLSRGAREVGLLALTEGTRRGERPDKIKEQMFDDVFHSLIHPLAGPLPQFVYTSATGKNVVGQRVSAHDDWTSNIGAAIGHANPVVASLGGGAGPGPVTDFLGLNPQPHQEQPTGGDRAFGMLQPFVGQTGQRPVAVRNYGDRFHVLLQERTAAHQAGQPYPNEREYQILNAFHRPMIELQHAIEGMAQTRQGIVATGRQADPADVRRWKARQLELAKRALELIQKK